MKTYVFQKGTYRVTHSVRGGDTQSYFIMSITLSVNSYLRKDSLMEVTATKDGRSVTVNYDFGKDIKTAMKLFGEEVVYTNYIASAKIALQATLRSLIAAGKKDNEIAEFCSQWKLGVKSKRGKSPMEKLMESWAKLSPEQQAEMRKMLKG